jgi:peptidoglycan/LPS O-acetylase OafA/YrhL
MRKSNDRNMGLQALRGMAASSVVIYHAAHYTNARLNSPWLEEIFNGNFGYYGVLIFFVLSGFLMESAVQRYSPGKFLLHRLARLYPTYWALFFCIYLAQTVRLRSFDSIPWASLSLLPLGPRVAPLGVEWTLLYEVFFYGVCTLLCFRPRLFWWVLLVWSAIVLDAIFQHNQFGTVMQPTPAQIPFSLWNLGFICGGLAGSINRRLQLPDPAQLWLIGLAMFLLSFILGPATRIFLAGPGIACIVIALTRWPAADAAPPAGLPMRILVLLGEYSYGIYLIHVMSIAIVLQYVPTTFDPLHVYTAMLGVGLAAGIAAGMLDVALYQWLKAWIDSRFPSADRTTQSVVATSDKMSGGNTISAHIGIPKT